MLLLRKPNTESVRQFLSAQARLEYTYTGVATTATTPPPGYTVDCTRIVLGKDETTFNLARAALERWAHFDLGWVEALAPKPAITTGEVVAVLARAVGVWWLNACRIVYVVDD